jgi:hypothetical protein
MLPKTLTLHEALAIPKVLTLPKALTLPKVLTFAKALTKFSTTKTKSFLAPWHFEQRGRDICIGEFDQLDPYVARVG